MRKIILLGMAIALAATMLGLGVQAQLSDTEKTLSKAKAGVLDLTVDGKNGALVEVDFGDCLAPNKCWLPDACHMFTLDNVGCIDGYVNITGVAVTNLENEIKEPEAEAGDTTDPEGELGSQLIVQLSYFDPFGVSQHVYRGPADGLNGKCFKLNNLLKANCDLDFIIECVDWPDGCDNNLCMSDIVKIEMTLSLTQNKL